MNTRDESGMLAATTPLVTSTRPLASVWMTLITQVLRLPFGIGSGAAKKQLASSAHEPARPPPFAAGQSGRHMCCVLDARVFVVVVDGVPRPYHRRRHRWQPVARTGLHLRSHHPAKS